MKIFVLILALLAVGIPVQFMDKNVAMVIVMILVESTAMTYLLLVPIIVFARGIAWAILRDMRRFLEKGP